MKKKNKYIYIISCTTQDGAGCLFMAKNDHPIFERVPLFCLHEAVPVSHRSVL